MSGSDDAVWLERFFGSEATILRDARYRLLLLANVNSALGTVLVSPILESLTGPFGVSEAAAGLMVTAFVAPSVVGIPVVGVLADRCGRKPILVIGLVLFGGAGAAVALTTRYEVVLRLRALQGVGAAGIGPIVIASIGDLYSDARETTAMGLRFTTMGAGQTVFPLAAGVLVTAAWQYPFLIYAMALPVAALVYLRFSEPAPREDSGRGGFEGSYPRAFGSFVREPRALATLAALAVPPFIYIGFVTYNSFLVVRVLSGTPGQAGLLLAIVNVVYATAASQSGRVMDYFESRTIPVIGAFLFLAVGMSAFSLSPSLSAAAASVGVMAIGGGTSISLLFSSVTALAPERLRAGFVSIGQSINRLTTALTPIAIGAALAFLEPSLGFGSSVRLVFLAVAAIGPSVGIVAVTVAHFSPEITE